MGESPSKIERKFIEECGADNNDARLMRYLVVACIQYDSKLLDVNRNMQHVNQMISKDLQNHKVDLLVLPELAFYGYLFPDQQSVRKVAEDADSGATIDWAKNTSRLLDCYVVVGFPELGEDGNIYNSLIVTNPAGAVLKKYRKSFLFDQEKHWATAGSGFQYVDIPNLGRVGLGICMDLNPEDFKADWSKFELANFNLANQTDFLICIMAWLKSDGDDGHMSYIKYWACRLGPYLHSNSCFIACNRIGREGLIEYCGSSCILQLGDNLSLLGNLNENEEEILICHVTLPDKCKF